MNEINDFSLEGEMYSVIIRRYSDISKIECLLLNKIGLERCKQDKSVQILEIKKENFN